MRKGISIFNASLEDFQNFEEGLEESVNYKKIFTSDFERNIQGFENFEKVETEFLLIFQNREVEKLTEFASVFADKIVFPAVFKKIPIAFFSTNDKSDYTTIEIQGSQVHNEIRQVSNLLLIEQVFNLFEKTNLQFLTPQDFYENSEKEFLTPIEKIFKIELERQKILFATQIKIGKFFADFLVEQNGKKVVVECDGKEFHNPQKDKERDEILLQKGFETLRFSGSEIFHDVEKCVLKVKNYLFNKKNKSVKTVDKDLDLTQQSAIESVSGPIRVLAPAGSGKTKTLTNRIANLVNKGISESQILALAFNKKAAQEMSARLELKKVKVAKRLNQEGVVVRTFHSFGYEILRESLKWNFELETMKIQERNLMVRASQEVLENVPKFSWNDAIEVFLETLQKVKMELLPLETTTVDLNGEILPFHEIFNRFLVFQNKFKFLTFNDMIYLSLRILLKDKVLRQKLQNRFEFVLVDEFQDLNQSQLLMMQTLALPQNNLFIVGDDDQMIYGWRGAKVGHILDFPKRYSVAKDFTLSTNYRSAKKIVRHSRWLIEYNKNRVQKNILPVGNAKSGVFNVHLSETLFEQAIEAVDWIFEQKNLQKAKFKDFAVLCRFHEYQFPIAMILDSKGIAHTPVNYHKLFSKNPGKDIFAYLAVILFPQDAKKEHFSRILKRPNKYFTNKLVAQAKDFDSFVELKEAQGLEDWKRENIASFISKVSGLIRKESSVFNSPSKLVTAISEEFNFKKFYEDEAKKNDEVEDASDLTIFEVIRTLASSFERNKEFYDYVYKAIHDDSFEVEEEVKADKIQLATIHSTKGKEFKNVVYFNLTENDGKLSDPELEEERRVCYVGITRAIENLLITSPKEKKSRFLSEILRNPKFDKTTLIQVHKNLAQKNLRLKQVETKLSGLEKNKTEILKKFPELEGEVSGRLESSEIFRVEKEIEFLKKKFPELEGAELKTDFSLFKEFQIKKRIRSLEEAKTKIIELEQRLERLKNKVVEKRSEELEQSSQALEKLLEEIAKVKENSLRKVQDEISEIEIEIKSRKLLK